MQLTAMLVAAPAILAALGPVCAAAAPVGVHVSGKSPGPGSVAVAVPGPVPPARKTIAWNSMSGSASKRTAPKPYWDATDRAADRTYGRHDQHWEATMKNIRTKKGTTEKPKMKTTGKARITTEPGMSPYRKTSEGVRSDQRASINASANININTKATAREKGQGLGAKQKGKRMAHRVETVPLDDSQMTSPRVWKSYHVHVKDV